MRENSQTLKVNPVGRRYMGYLAIFNSGDPERIRAYIAENYTEEALAENSVDDLLAWHMHLFELTGGLRIHNVYLSQDHFVVVIVRDKLTDAMHMDKMKVSDEFPHKIIEYLHVPAET